jgi:transposase
MPRRLADRYHLVQNLREHLQRLLDHKRSCLPLVEDTAVKSSQPSAKAKADSPADLALGTDSDPAPGLLPSEQQGIQTCAEAVLSCLTYAERKKKISRDKRVWHYEEVMALQREGLGQRAIARQLRTSREHGAALCLLAWLS